MITISVLMVCMGNICRSPTAEAVLRHKLREAGLGNIVTVDSAGTHGWHAGSPPDSRSMAHAQRRGYDLAPLRSRLVRAADFEAFDYILAMDWDNLSVLEEQCPPQHRPKLGRLTQHARHHATDVVPDPYQGGAAGFEHVLDLVEDACEGFVAFLQQEKLAQRGGTS
jgi:protein-tyrosine phosphatase